MKRTWVLVANKAGARLFERKGAHKVKLVEKFDHPEGTLKEGDLNSDRSGTFGFQGIPRENQSVNHENEMFANDLSKYLEKGRTDHRFDNFVLIAGPGFNGVVKSKLNKQLEKILVKNIVKEISLEDEKRVCELSNQ
jgi:protein required for attachment to host cells